MKCVPVFPASRSYIPKLAQILKYFAQSCDCMIAALRNSGKGVTVQSLWTVCRCNSTVAVDSVGVMVQSLWTIKV